MADYMNNDDAFELNQGKKNDTLRKHDDDDDVVATNQFDGVFAQLTDMFGDLIPSDIILNVCKNCSWNLSHCIERLIDYSAENDNQEIMKKYESIPMIDSTCQVDQCRDNLKIAYKTSDLQDMDENVDVLIESDDVEIITPSQVEEIPQPITSLGAIKKKPRPNNPSQSDLFNVIENNVTNKNRVSFSEHLKHGENNFQDNHCQMQKAKSQTIIHPRFDTLVANINSGIKIMIIMRGLPGSGKSYLARKIIDESMKGDYRTHIFSSDDFFYDINGVYFYQRDKIAEAHTFNQNRVNRKVYSGWSPIIVDNTNMQLWEMEFYCKLAVQFGYCVEILEPTTLWAWSAGKLAQKNSHQVAKDKIELMMSKYEEVKDACELISIFRLSYNVTLPQMRHYPLIDQPYSFLKYNMASNTIESSNDNQENVSNIVDETFEATNWKQTWSNESPPAKITIKPKPDWSFPKPPRTTSPAKISSNDSVFSVQNKNSSVIDYETHKQEVSDFWNRTANTESSSSMIDEMMGNAKDMLPDFNEKIQRKIVKQQSKQEGQPPLEKHKKDCPNENEFFAQVRQLYPFVPIDYLWDLFEHCNGDGNWTVNILLTEDSKVNEFMNSDKTLGHSSKDFTCNCDNNDYKEEPWDDNSAAATITKNYEESMNPQSQRQRSRKLNKNENLDIKRQIEESFVLGDEHYSENMRKIRNTKMLSYKSAPATTTQASQTNEIFGVYNPSITAANTSQAIDKTEVQSSSSTSSDAENEEIIEINLGEELVQQLDNIFGIESYQKETQINSDIKTNIFMPKSLAQQLYALWMESLFNQMEEQRLQAIREDEDIARNLSGQLNARKVMDKQPKNFKEIVDMEFAWAAYEKNEWKNTTPQDLALQLSRQKLYDIFPTVDKNALTEMLAAHNNKFEDTVNTLKKTLQYDLDDKLQTEGEELLNKAKRECEKASDNYNVVVSRMDNTEQLVKVKSKTVDEDKRAALREFEECRNMAMHHNQLKAECYRKAQEAIQKGETSTAVYYSQIANLHKNKIDTFNHIAANHIIDVHNFTQNNPNMLDLHYLHVAEAIECLDIFLDKHIDILRKPTNRQNFKNIFVITGRGLHSAGGIPTIKHKVKGRLKERGLKFNEVNPGLLKAKVFIQSKMTHDF